MTFYQISTIFLSLFSVTLAIKLNEYPQVINKLETSNNELQSQVQLLVLQSKGHIPIVTVEKVTSDSDFFLTYSPLIMTALIAGVLCTGLYFISESYFSSQADILNQINEVKTLSGEQSAKILTTLTDSNVEMSNTINAIQGNVMQTHTVVSQIQGKLVLDNINQQVGLYHRTAEAIVHTKDIVVRPLIENPEIASLIDETMRMASSGS